MTDYYKEKAKNLIALRSNLFTSVIVLTGGIAGLFFTNSQLIKVLIFGIIGAYFDIIFLLNIMSVNKEIDLMLEEIKHEHK